MDSTRNRRSVRAIALLTAGGLTVGMAVWALLQSPRGGGSRPEELASAERAPPTLAEREPGQPERRPIPGETKAEPARADPKEEAQELLDDFLRRLLGVAEIEECWDLVEEWAGQGEKRVPVLLALLKSPAPLDARQRELLDEICLQALERVAGAEGAAKTLTGGDMSRPLPRRLEAWFAARASTEDLVAHIAAAKDMSVLLWVPEDRLRGMAPGPFARALGYSASRDPKTGPAEGPGGGSEAVAREARAEMPQERGGEVLGGTPRSEVPSSDPAWRGLLRLLAIQGDAGAISSLLGLLTGASEGAGPGGGAGVWRSPERSFAAALPAAEQARLLTRLLGSRGRIASLRLEALLEVVRSLPARKGDPHLAEAVREVLRQRPDLRVLAAATYLALWDGAPEAPRAKEAFESHASGNREVLAETLHLLSPVTALRYLAAFREEEVEDRERKTFWLDVAREHLASRIAARFLKEPSAVEIQLRPEALDLALEVESSSWSRETSLDSTCVWNAFVCYLRSLAGERRSAFASRLTIDMRPEALRGLDGSRFLETFLRLLLPLDPGAVADLEVALQNSELLQPEFKALLGLLLDRMEHVRSSEAHRLLDDARRLFETHPDEDIRAKALRLSFRLARNEEEVRDLLDRSFRAENAEGQEAAAAELTRAYTRGALGAEALTHCLDRFVREGRPEDAREAFDALEDLSFEGIRPSDLEVLRGFLARTWEGDLHASVRQEIKKVLSEIEKLQATPPVPKEKP